MLFLMKKIISYVIDYVLIMSFVEIFTFCAKVFYLEPATAGKGVLMLVCAFIMVLYFTTYVPVKTNGQTFGQKWMKLQVVNKSGTERTYLQSFIRECVVKISAAPVFIVFTVCYFVISAAAHKTWEIELPLDFILKTKVVDMKSKV